MTGALARWRGPMTALTLRSGAETRGEGFQRIAPEPVPVKRGTRRGFCSVRKSILNRNGSKAGLSRRDI